MVLRLDDDRLERSILILATRGHVEADLSPRRCCILQSQITGSCANVHFRRTPCRSADLWQ